jgi:16S rRNA processing protein RimM
MDQNYLLSFDGLDDCDVVSHLRNQLVYLPSDQLEIPQEGKHYPHQVLGMQVLDEAGVIIGRLEEVLITGANDVYVVRQADKEEEILLPAIDSVILKVDTEKQMITVRLPIWE